MIIYLFIRKIKSFYCNFSKININNFKHLLNKKYKNKYMNNIKKNIR